MPPSQDDFAATQMRHSASATMSNQPLTPPIDSSPLNERMQSEQYRIDGSTSSDDNTAAGMALSQEHSMYLTPATSPTMSAPEEKETTAEAQSETQIEDDGIKYHTQPRPADQVPDYAQYTNYRRVIPGNGVNQHRVHRMEMDTSLPTTAPKQLRSHTPDATLSPAAESIPRGLAKIDLEMDRASQVRAWDFSDQPPTSRSPSALFQPCAKYVGTQQSDRQIYNVEVTILTVDMEQSSMSGYLLIRGLTPEHPMLQTFFTGEIVGGPNQRYSFKTKDPAWGASDKVDLQHWLRFPPWRQLSAHAKRDMSFDFPLNHEAWWNQDHVFMRWKEHFLVPDHRQSNITGASFEGFYYICLNQAEGKISGVYFHSKSEKYQQLELTHVTKKGLGVFGTSPVVELR